MKKSTLTNIPTITLAECIKELELINGNVFQLKMGVKTLIEMIENDMSNDKLKEAVKVFNLSQILSNLEYKD